VTRRHRKIRRILVSEAGGCCAVCGYDRCAYNLHFHHVDPATKSTEMSMGSGKGLETYRAEATKCVLVCANCHGEIETGLIDSPPAGARYGDESPPAPDPKPRVEQGPPLDTAQLRLELGDVDLLGGASPPHPSAL
jgi:hypothetical protein